MDKVNQTIMNVIEGSSLLNDKKPKYIGKYGDRVIFHYDNNIIDISSCDRNCCLKITDMEFGVTDEFNKANLESFMANLNLFYEGIKPPKTDGEIFDYFYKEHKHHVASVNRIYRKQREDI